MPNWKKVIISGSNASLNQLGIGTTSPSSKLQVSGGNTNTAATALFSIQKDEEGYGLFAGLLGSGTSWLQSSTKTQSAYYGLSLQPNGGNVGIGTTSPASKLEVQDGTLTVDNGNIDVISGGISVTRNSANNIGLTVNQQGTADILNLQDNGVEVFTVIDGGNVGIGTTSPSQKLSLEISDTGTTQATFKGMVLSNSDTTVNNGSAISFSHTAASSNSHAKIGATYEDRTGGSEDTSLFFGTLGGGAYGERMRITSTGNVGIGTASPGAKLEVSGTGNQKLLVNRTDGDNFFIDAQNGQIRLRGSSNIIMGVGADVLTVTDSNVGIGTTSPTSKLTVSSDIAGDGSWDDSGILISNTATSATGESALVFKNAGSTGTGTSYWFTGLNQSTEYRLAYGTSFSNANSRLTLGSGGILTLNTYGTGARTGTAAYNLSVDSSGNVIESTIGGVAPATPGNIVSTIVGQTIEIEFDESTTANIGYYQVWSSDDGGDFGIIAQISPSDFSSTMTVVDTTFVTGGTMSYRVYAVKSGVYSSPGTTSKTYTVGALDVTDMTVINLNTAYYIQYEKPASRFIDHIEIYMDSQTTQGALSRSNASIIYSGQNTSYMKSVGVSNNFHQFWVEVVTT